MGDHVPREMTVKGEEQFHLTEPGLQISGSGPATLRVRARGVVAFHAEACTSWKADADGVSPSARSPTAYQVVPVIRRPFMSRLFSSLIIGTALGCASAPTPARPADPAPESVPERAPLPSLPTRAPSLFTYQSGSYTYDVRQTTVVTVTSDPVTLVADTLQTVAGLTYSISMSGGAPAVAIVVDSLVVRSLRDTAASSVRRLASPVMVQPPVIPPPVVTAADSMTLLSTCDSMEEAARIVAGDTYLQIPGPVERNQSWSDSTSVVVCRGGIPLTATRISRFRIDDVRESRDSVVARVIRQTTLSVSGTGLQGTRQITIRGEGTSETAFTYDLRAGRFLESTGQSTLRIGFETIQQTEQIIQQSSSSVRLRAATPGGAPQ